MAEFEEAWKKFIYNMGDLISSRKDDATLKPFEGFQRSVLDFALEERFVKQLGDEWEEMYKSHQNNQGAKALLMEIQAFSESVDAHRNQRRKRWTIGWLFKYKWKEFAEKLKLISRGSTVIGSVKDIFKNLPDWAKITLTLFKELADIFKK